METERIKSKENKDTQKDEEKEINDKLALLDSMIGCLKGGMDIDEAREERLKRQ